MLAELHLFGELILLLWLGQRDFEMRDITGLMCVKFSIFVMQLFPKSDYPHSQVFFCYTLIPFDNL